MTRGENKFGMFCVCVEQCSCFFSRRYFCFCCKISYSSFYFNSIFPSPRWQLLSGYFFTWATYFYALLCPLMLIAKKNTTWSNFFPATTENSKNLRPEKKIHLRKSQRDSQVKHFTIRSGKIAIAHSFLFTNNVRHVLSIRLHQQNVFG